MSALSGSLSYARFFAPTSLPRGFLDKTHAKIRHNAMRPLSADEPRQADDALGHQPLQAPLTFEAGNHDDLFRIVGLQRGSGRFDDADEAAAFAIGLKLLSETVLKHRDDVLLQQLRAPLGDFIRQLKAATPPQA